MIVAGREVLACRFGHGLCPAYAAAGTPYCTVHQPEAILNRAEAIVRNNFGPAIAAGLLSKEEATKLRDDILYQLKETA